MHTTPAGGASSIQELVSYLAESNLRGLAPTTRTTDLDAAGSLWLQDQVMSQTIPWPCPRSLRGVTFSHDQNHCATPPAAKASTRVPEATLVSTRTPRACALTCYNFVYSMGPGAQSRQQGARVPSHYSSMIPMAKG